MRTQSTIHPRTGQGRTLVPAIFAAALVLGGCAATHVGDSWQCPLAQGAACTSVAEADPAVAAPGKAQGLATRTPLYQAKTGNAKGTGASCAEGCDPLAWLAKWFWIVGDRDGTAEESTETGCPPTAAPPAAPEPVPPSEVSPDATGDRLRTQESIARIWIAPFVDADGVYREAHWVRAVLEPAHWRLP